MITPNSQLSVPEVVNDIRHNVGFFAPDPYLRLGESDSAHGVIFGNLAQYGEVAVKGFTKLAKASNEARNLVNVEQRGLDALEPLLVAEGGLGAYLVTRRIDGLRNLGQVKWQTNVATRRLATVLEPTLEVAAGTLAEWHKARVFHGDAQVKNVAYDMEDQPVYIDAERTSFNHTGDTAASKADTDLKKFGISALGRGLLEDKSPEYRASFMNQVVLDPYFDAINIESSMSTEVRRQVIEQYWVAALHRNWTPAWERSAA